MPQSPRSSIRLATRVVATVLLASVALFGLADSAAAQPPPAGFIQMFAHMVKPCSVKTTLSLLGGDKYARGDTVQIAVQMERLGGLWRRRIRTRIPPAPTTQLARGTIDPSTIGAVEEESAEPELTFRTISNVFPATIVTAIINYQVKSTATAGPVTLTGTPSSLLANGAAEPGCASQSSNVIFTIVGTNQFDLAVNASATPTTIDVDQAFDINATVINTNAANIEVPTNLAFEVTVALPTGLSFTGLADPAGASARPSPPATPTEVYWTRSTGANPIPIGGSYSPSFRLTLDSDATFRPSYVVQVCVQPTTQWGIDNEGPKPNNCTNVTVTVSPLRMTKTWSDGSMAIRGFGPNAGLTFRVSVENVSTAPIVTNLTDILASDINCDPLESDNCPAWDETIYWTSIPPGFSADPVTHIVSSIGTVPLGSGGYLAWDFQAAVVDQTTLYAKLRPDKLQPRCNEWQGQVVSPAINTHKRLCWTYNVTTDLRVNKTFKLDSGGTSDTLSLKQGGVGTYKIDVTNTGSHPGFGVDLIDQQLNEANHGVNQPHLVQWVASSITDPNTTIDQTNHSLSGWSNPEIGLGETKSLEPQFAVRCDARNILANLGLTGQNFVDNQASITAANDSTPANNHNTNQVRATITDGHYNLGVLATATPTNVVPQDPTRRRTTVRVTATNAQDGQVNQIAVPYVTVEAEIPTQFTVDASTIVPGGSVVTRNNKEVVIWQTIPSIAIDGTALMTVVLEVKADAVKVQPPPTVALTARSVSAGVGCGVATFNLGIDIQGPEFSQIKSLVDPADGSAGLGDIVTFELRVTNLSPTYNFSRASLSEGMKVTDPLDPNLSYTAGVGNASCKLYSPPTNPSGVNCNAEQQSTPTEESTSPQVLSWRFSQLNANTAVVWQFKAQVQSSLVLSVCPQPLYNSSGNLPATLTDLKNPGLASNFNPILLQIFADQCLDGNIYARSDAGIIIRSTDVKINPNSILSSKGSVDCGTNTTCLAAPWRVGNYATDRATNGLWHLDEGNGQSTADSSGNNYNGTLGSTSGPNSDDPTWAVGAFSSTAASSGLNFDGTDDYVSIPDSDSLDLSTAGTISFWFNRTSGQKVHIGKWNSAGNYSYVLQIFSDNLIYFHVSNTGNSSTYFISNAPTTLTGWHHLAGVYNGSTLAIYLDGSPVAGTINGSVPGSIFNSSAPFYIGRYNIGGVGTFAGAKMDDVRLYNRALSSSEVTNLYGKSDITNGAVGVWRFDEASGQTIADSSGNGNNGTLGSTASPGSDDPAWTDGILPAGTGASLNFDGGDQLYIGDQPALEAAGNSFTAEAWIKPSSGSLNGMILAKKGDTSNGYYLWVNGNGKLNGYILGPGGSVDVSSTASVNDDSWHHVAMVRRTNTLSLYVDGLADGTATASSNIGDASNNLAFRLGRSDHSSPHYFNGRIDEVRVSNASVYASNFTRRATPFTADSASYGLDFTKVVNRMSRNIQRLKSNADSLTLANNTINIGAFNLYGDKPAVNYPEGRVYKVDGDLIIDTGGPNDSLKFSGKGTIIVNGNLTITGQGKMTYIDSAAKNAIGFIVLPTSPDNGNITVTQDVKQLVGAYYAPGTTTATLNTTIPVTSGRMVFDNTGSVTLRPARGLFIARQFIFAANSKIVLQYNPLLNTAAGAPPGFKFAASPKDTEEGL